MVLALLKCKSHMIYGYKAGVRLDAEGRFVPIQWQSKGVNH